VVVSTWRTWPLPPPLLLLLQATWPVDAAG